MRLRTCVWNTFAVVIWEEGIHDIASIVWTQNSRGSQVHEIRVQGLSVARWTNRKCFTSSLAPEVYPNPIAFIVINRILSVGPIAQLNANFLAALVGLHIVVHHLVMVYVFGQEACSFDSIATMLYNSFVRDPRCSQTHVDLKDVLMSHVRERLLDKVIECTVEEATVLFWVFRV